MRFTLVLLSGIAAVTMQLNAEVDVGRPAGGTPYDAYLGPMRQTYSRLSGGSPSISDVRAQLRTAYRFRYYFDPAQPYTPQLPEVTESRQQGDCKAKSLWLASKMGTRSARYVIGKGNSIRGFHMRGSYGRTAARGSFSIRPTPRRSSTLSA
jgi:hypothetical protein